MPDTVLTAGALLVKDMLPDPVKKHYDTSVLLDKKGVSTLMSDLVKHGGPDTHTALSNLSSLFFNTATNKGFTTPLTDYENDSAEKQTMLNEFSHRVNLVNKNTTLTQSERNYKLNTLADKFGDRLKSQNLKYLLGQGSTAAKMANTGARGNPSQLNQGTGSPIMAKDIMGNPLPIAIKRSFAEGLSSAEHMAMSYEGRGNTVKTQLSTSLPGALFKKITPTVFHEVITIEDCGTRNGIPVEVKDSQRLIGKYIAGTNTQITEESYKELLMSTKKTVKIRNSMTCEATEGICQKCYGVDSKGGLPEVGTNVGVVAAQSISEVLTQAMLATKHKSNVGKQRNAYEEANNLLMMPANFQDEATISSLDGKVTKIEKTSLNDHYLHIDGNPHFVPNIQGITVKKGQTVKAGDALSTGTINPKQLVALRGLGEGRKYMSNKLREVYGGGLDPRHFDVVSKNLMKHVEVKDAGQTGFMPGQIVEVGHIEPYLKKHSSEVTLKQAEGKKLALRVLELLPGTTLNKNHVEYLSEHGVSKVTVSDLDLVVEPLVKGLGTAKLLDKNWISRLSYNQLSKSIQEAAALGESSDIHGTDPIAAYIMGSEFGTGKGGKY